MADARRSPSPILVVSADSVRRELACVILKRRGADVSHVDSLSGAIRVLETGRHEALLLDMQSIFQDGRGATEKLIAVLRGIRLILVAPACGEEAVITRLREAAAAEIAPSLNEHEMVGVLKLLVQAPPNGIV